jgi:hypothetical protein
MYHAGDLHQMWATARETHLTFNLITFMASLLLLALVAATYVFGRSRPVYLINFHCYKPPAQCVLGCFLLLLNVLHAPQSSIQAPAYIYLHCKLPHSIRGITAVMHSPSDYGGWGGSGAETRLLSWVSPCSCFKESTFHPVQPLLQLESFQQVVHAAVPERWGVRPG